jgi:hypothetical protein
VEHRKSGWKPAPGAPLTLAGAEGGDSSVRG